MVNVGGQPSGRSRETVTRQIQAAELVSVGQKCDLQLRIPGVCRDVARWLRRRFLAGGLSVICG